MQLITTKEIVDVIKYNDESVIIVEKLPLPNGTQYKVQYSVINFNKAITEYNAIYELLSDRKMKILCRGQAKKSAGWMPWH